MDSEFFPLEVKASGIHGTGCYSAGHIPAGARIVEYVGERIGYDEAIRRDDPASDRHSCYIFCLSDGIFIDGMVSGNKSSFINHSCEPNCRISREDGRIFIVSLRDIGPSEELTYDYSFGPDFRMPCLCGSDNCRGYI